MARALDATGTREPRDTDKIEGKGREQEGNGREQEGKGTDIAAVASATRGARYSDQFENEFWKPYPRTPIMSKPQAWKAWQKASADDRPKIIAAVPRYLAYLKSKPDLETVHACRFISQRRFDGFTQQEAFPHDVQKTGNVVAAADRLLERLASLGEKPVTIEVSRAEGVGGGARKALP
jgi:hypothetical protein